MAGMDIEIGCTILVSIRSLHQSTGRYDSAGMSLCDATRQCFNPLPAPKCREIQLPESAGGDFAVSIRSLHQSTGRWSIRAAREAAKQFQSAPCTKVQGDCLPLMICEKLRIS